MTTALVVTDEPQQEKRRDAPLGIHFGLHEQDYHDDVGCGSGDMRRLSYSPSDWWWQSKWNPLWEPDKDTEAKIYGRAVHHAILEGREKFDSHYAKKKLNWATREGKEEKAMILGQGKLPIDVEDWGRILLTGSMVRSNPHLARAFDDTVGNEVSIFWERGGLKRKCRIDALKLRAIVDLKNVSNDRSISFPRACLRKIDEYSYHIQAAHYLEGRLAMQALFKKGLVFGDCDMGFLEQVVNEPQFAFVFIFVQSSGAPLTWSTKLSFKKAIDWTDPDTGEIHPQPEEANPAFALGQAQLDRAEKNFGAYLKKFGLSNPWVLDEPIEEFDVNDMPPWFLRNAESEAI